MTFQRSIYTSVFVHLILFGTAIAFAHMANGMLTGHRDVITVSLVSPGEGQAERSAGPAVEPRKRTAGAQRRHKAAILPAESPLPDHPREMSTSLPEQAGEGKEQPPATGSTSPSGATTGSGGETVTAAAASPSGFGLISAEQWAVISSAIERSKQYPRMARERGVQGTVRLRFKVRPTGTVETVEVVKSSGSEILDTASVKTVYNAGPLPYVNGWVEVPIAYVLQ